MDSKFIISELRRNKFIFNELLTGLNSEIVNFKPEKGKWSLLEIICHLCDEEREDFRYRLKSVLESPEKDWPKIDPVDWVNSRNYSDQDFNAKILEFSNERDKTVQWLMELNDPDWNNAYNHPKVGPVTAQLLLVNWLAHDYLHIRQIIWNKYVFIKEKYPVPLDYAGEW